MLIPEDLTVKELKQECLKIDGECRCCKYDGSCNGVGVYDLRLTSEYSNFTKQEIEIMRFYSIKGYREIWYFENAKSVVFDNGAESCEIPEFLMHNFPKDRTINNRFNIKDYLEWHDSNIINKFYK